MSFSLPDLPYPKDALSPYVSADTLDFHHGKHHKTYVDKLNSLIDGTDLANETLEEIIKKSAADSEKANIFNNAAQVWNHTFYWNSMKPGGGGKPAGVVADKIQEDFGGFDKFAEQFKNAGVTQFGSGWAWLVLKEGKLQVVKTLNAENPMIQGVKPLLTMDVWEHAYYLDYQNRRPDYIDAFINNLINWEFVSSQLE
ncbi:superoxide dismutase [Desulfonatronovibrio magnus]|uniref:superoxide dismutase n=1 Tax=Desulfonatronovibrio magnus TaxID=698827 RepID=UPI0005EAE8A6|nr:superoxide dismutase [Desulfonatronovibrio magnus]